MLVKGVKKITTLTSGLPRGACAFIVNTGTSASISNSGTVGSITINYVPHPRHFQQLDLPRWYSNTIDSSLIDRVNTYGKFVMCTCIMYDNISV